MRVRRIRAGIGVLATATIGSILLATTGDATTLSAQWQSQLAQGGPSWVRARMEACRRMPPGDRACPVLQWRRGAITLQLGYANLDSNPTESPAVRMDMTANTHRVTTDHVFPYVNVFVRIQWPARSVPGVSYITAALVGANGHQNVGFGGALDLPVNAYVAPGMATIRLVLYTIPHYGHPGPNLLKALGYVRVQGQGIRPNVAVGAQTSDSPGDLVQGQMQANVVGYARVAVGAAFGNPLLTFRVWHRVGTQWQSVIDEGVPTNPQADIRVVPFMVAAAGHYRAEFFDGTLAFGATAFTVAPNHRVS